MGEAERPLRASAPRAPRAAPRHTRRGVRVVDEAQDIAWIPARYSRQVLFAGLAASGQRALIDATVVVVGCGGLGCMQATLLVRAGVGRVRIIDRDLVEESNLQRQVLFDEADARELRPKAAAAAEQAAGRELAGPIEGLVEDLNSVSVGAAARGRRRHPRCHRQLRHPLPAERLRGGDRHPLDLRRLRELLRRGVRVLPGDTALPAVRLSRGAAAGRRRELRHRRRARARSSASSRRSRSPRRSSS